MEEQLCNFCEAFVQKYDRERPGHCYGCEALQTEDDDQEEGTF